MRWHELVEAPISNIELVPPKPNADFESGTSFGAVDRKLLQSEKGREKIVRAFTRTPHVFEVFFYSNNEIDGDSQSNNENVDTLADLNKAGVHTHFGDIEGKPGVIRVVQLSNLSPVSAKIPLTGWMLAHKIAHAIQDQVTTKGWRGALGKQVESLNRLISEIADIDDGDYFGPYSAAFSYPDNLRRKLTMKSAANNDNPFEMFAEIIAQYLVTGSVKMKLSNKKAIALLDKLNASIKAMFGSLEGKVLVEV